MNCPYCIKICSVCGEILVANEINFYKSKKGKWGLESRCKECRKKRWKEFYEDNTEKEKERQKKYREDNPEKYKEIKRRYKENNPEKYKEIKRRYKENNPEKYKESNKVYCKKYRVKNLEKIRERQRESSKKYAENNPEKLFNNRIKRRLKEENQGKGLTKEQWLEMMRFFDWKCAYSGEKLDKDTRTIDHIVALNNGGENEVWNCVPMYRSYNSSKHTSDMLEWYIEQEFFDINRLRKIFEWRDYAFEKWGNQ